jgi:hypothetical protein
MNFLGNASTVNVTAVNKGTPTRDRTAAAIKLWVILPV